MDFFGRLSLPLVPARVRSVWSHFHFHAFRSGLNAKLLLIIVGVSLIGVLTSSSLILTLQREQLIDSALAATTRESNVIQSSLEHAMLRNDQQMVSQVIQTMVDKKSIEHIRILDDKGVVYVSSSPTEVGERFDYSDPACQFCHVNGARPSNQTAILPTRDNHEALLNVNLIYNSPQCQSCHDPQNRILGIMAIEMPLVDLNSQLTAGFWRITLAALVTLGLLVGLMLLALRRLVIQPVGELTRGMTEIRGGNLDYLLHVPSRDELGDLAEAFNAMRQRLKSTHTENALLLTETRRREQETIALHRLMMSISASLEIQQVLDAIAEGAREILNADISAVGLVDETHHHVLVKACAGTRTENLKGLAIPLGELISGKHSVKPICIEKWRPDLPLPRIAELIAQEGIVSSLAAPLWSNGRLHGYVGVMTRQPRHFTKEDTQLFMSLALQVVVAIENAELYRQMRYLAILEERDRLAREMHDNLAQMLGYMNIKTAIIDDQLGRDQVTQARSSLLELKRIAKEAYTDVREAIFNLRSTMPSGYGLVPVLKEYLAEYRAHCGIDAQLAVEDAYLAMFPAEVEVQVNRIIQEALTNVRKHSGASKVWVRFERDNHHVKIRIEDDGKGFDPAQLKQDGQRHFGLQIMRERAESVGGELEIDSQIGCGTRVTLQVAMFPRIEDPHESTAYLVGR